MQKRLLILPIAWLTFGAGEVFALQYLLGPIADIAPTSANDKPIGGSILPVLFFNVTALALVTALSLYSLGIWNLDLSNRKTKTDITALAVLLLSGLLLWYSPVALFTGLVSLVYFLAVNID